MGYVRFESNNVSLLNGSPNILGELGLQATTI